MQKESRVVEGHLMADHVHMLLSITQKYSVSQVVEFIKGKKCNSYCMELFGTQEEFHGLKFLGRRLLCDRGR
jgi:putative transposase